MSKRALTVGLLALGVLAAGLAVWQRGHRVEAPDTGPASAEVNLDPSDPTERWPARYRGNPLLLVTEAYVLDTIGELPPRMKQLIPDLVQRSFKKAGDWKVILRGEIGWKDDIDQTIRQNWERYQKAAKDAGQPADPLDFAQQFADAVDKAMGGMDGGR